MKSYIPKILILIVFGGLAYFLFGFLNQEKPVEVVQEVSNEEVIDEEKFVSETEYKNPNYGFSFYLPDTWVGYSVIEDEWEGYSIASSGSQVPSETGALITLRHPDWEYKSPRQDIPIMVLTLTQWKNLNEDKFHIGAAPIGPTEIGRNNRYVFALPARYNYAFFTGFEEVQELLEKNPLHTF
ncbi:MAG: hypothetical protein V4690_03970 [Patescibacteria group bacterium]